MSKLIKNNTKDTKNISVEKFLKWEFNNLKESQGRDVTELVNSILEFGFAIPVFIWKKDNEVYVLDGTGRSLAVKQMLADGYEFESIPYVEIEAKTKKQAMELVPSIASSFGETTRDSMIRFSKGLNLKFENIKIEGISKLILDGDNFNFKDKNKEIILGGNNSNGSGSNGTSGGHGGSGDDEKVCPNCGYELN